MPPDEKSSAESTRPAEAHADSQAPTSPSAPVRRSAVGRQPPLNYYFLSDLLKARVRFEGDSKPFGRLNDIGARKTTGAYPIAASLEVKRSGRGTIVIPWSDVLEFSRREIVVRKEPGQAPQADFWLRRDVLDDQVVDLTGAQVVRVNDVHVLHAEGQIIIAHVQVGFIGILRRLGFERIGCFLLRWLLDYKLRDRFVTWAKVELISPGTAPVQVRVSATSSELAAIHAGDLADIMEELGVRERKELLDKLPVETVAEALEEMDPEIQRSFIVQEIPDKAADILEEMPTKDAAAVLRDMDHSYAQQIIGRMESEAAEDIRAVLAHDEKSAGGMMATFCIEAKAQQRAAEVMERIRPIADKVEILNHIYVLDDNRHLIGLLNLRELLHAAPDTAIGDLMTTNLVTVSPATRPKDIARIFGKYGFRTIPVVDENNVFLGAVRLTSVLAELSPIFWE